MNKKFKHWNNSPKIPNNLVLSTGVNMMRVSDCRDRLRSFLLHFFSLVLGIALLASCAQIEPIKDTVVDTFSELWTYPKIEVAHVRYGASSPESLELVTGLTLQNEHAFAVPISSIDYIIELEGYDTPLASKVVDDVDSIGSESIKTVDVPAEVIDGDLTYLVERLLREPIPYTLRGNVRIFGVGVPYKSSGTLRAPDVRALGVDINTSSRTNVDMTLHVDVENNNEFPLEQFVVRYIASSDNTVLLDTFSSTFTVDAMNTKQLALAFSINPANIYHSKLAVLSNPILPVAIRGVVDFGFMLIPFSVRSNLNLEQTARL